MIPELATPLFLIGLPASGKTTLGAAVAARLPGYRFVDLDKAVEASEGMSVGEIFRRRGEGYFRQSETRMLHEVAQTGPCVVACGGGTPCFSDNMDLMDSCGITVLLEADDERTAERLLLAPPGQRPMVDAVRHDRGALERYIADLRRRRSEFYGRARLRFDSNRLETAEDIARSAESLLSMLSQYITYPNCANEC